MQQMLTFDLPTKAGKCKVDSHVGRTAPTKPLRSSNIHSYIQYICLFLYNLRQFGAAGPERAQAEDEEDEEQYCHDGDYGDVACVGQRGSVWSLSWNHVGQIQHIAQRPACVTAFYLDTNTGKRRTITVILTHCRPKQFGGSI